MLLFRSLGMFGSRGKCLMLTVVTLLFGFFLIIPSEFFCLAGILVGWFCTNPELSLNDSLLVPARGRVGLVGLGRGLHPSMDRRHAVLLLLRLLDALVGRIDGP